MKKPSENKNRTSKEKFKKNLIKLFTVALGVGGLFIAVKLFFPGQFYPLAEMSGRYAKDMLLIFPAVLLLVGLADVWVPPKLIEKYLGRKSGFKGKLMAVFLGSLPTGPMYVAFPLAAELLRKKAGVGNIIVFLGVWASLKIPQIGVEIKFLGLKFAFLRFVFTLGSILLIGIVIEKILEPNRLSD